MSSRSQHLQFEDVIDLTGVTSYSRTSLLSNSVICIDSDDSFSFSPPPAPCQRVISSHHNNIQKATCGSAAEKGSKGKENYLGECPICWDKLGKKPLSSTMCGHVFCTICLKNSMSIEKRCPICRTVLKGKYAYHPIYLGK